MRPRRGRREGLCAKMIGGRSVTEEECDRRGRSWWSRGSSVRVVRADLHIKIHEVFPGANCLQRPLSPCLHPTPWTLPSVELGAVVFSS